jgi:hypothetical protein
MIRLLFLQYKQLDLTYCLIENDSMVCGEHFGEEHACDDEIHGEEHQIHKTNNWTRHTRCRGYFLTITITRQSLDKFRAERFEEGFRI